MRAEAGCVGRPAPQCHCLVCLTALLVFFNMPAVWLRYGCHGPAAFRDCGLALVCLTGDLRGVSLRFVVTRHHASRGFPARWSWYGATSAVRHSVGGGPLRSAGRRVGGVGGAGEGGCRSLGGGGARLSGARPSKTMAGSVKCSLGPALSRGRGRLNFLFRCAVASASVSPGIHSDIAR